MKAGWGDSMDAIDIIDGAIEKGVIVILLIILWYRVDKIEGKIDKLQETISKIWYRIAKLEGKRDDKG